MSTRRLTIRPPQFLPSEAISHMVANVSMWKPAQIAEHLLSAEAWHRHAKLERDNVAAILKDPIAHGPEAMVSASQAMTTLDATLAYRERILVAMRAAMASAEKAEKAAVDRGRKAAAKAKALKARRHEFDALMIEAVRFLAEAEQCISEQIECDVAEIVNPLSDAVIDASSPLYRGVLRSAAGAEIVNGTNQRVSRPYRASVTLTNLRRTTNSALGLTTDNDVFRLGAVELRVGVPQPVKVHPAMWPQVQAAEAAGQIRIEYN